MTGEIGLGVANNIELAHHLPSLNRTFPDRGADSLTLPRHVAWETDIYREQSGHSNLVDFIFVHRAGFCITSYEMIDTRLVNGLKLWRGTIISWQPVV
jgi:hypothetical protein